MVEVGASGGEGAHGGEGEAAGGGTDAGDKLAAIQATVSPGHTTTTGMDVIVIVRGIHDATPPKKEVLLLQIVRCLFQGGRFVKFKSEVLLKKGSMKRSLEFFLRFL